MYLNRILLLFAGLFAILEFIHCKNQVIIRWVFSGFLLCGVEEVLGFIVAFENAFILPDLLKIINVIT